MSISWPIVVLVGAGSEDEACEEIQLDVGPNSDPVRMCTLYASGQEGKGSLFPPDTISGEIVIADPIFGCGDLVNAKAVSGKLVVLDRGACTFDTKVANVLKAGAAAVIIANNRPKELFKVAGPTVGCLYVRRCVCARAWFLQVCSGASACAFTCDLVCLVTFSYRISQAGTFYTTTVECHKL